MSKTQQLTFQLLSESMARKAIEKFRRHAGWQVSNDRDHRPAHPLGKVQWVAVDAAQKQVGIARLELAPPEFCHVSDLIILQEYRGHGIGRWLIRNIEQYAMRSKIRRLCLEPGAGTQAFYQSVGFAPEPRLPGIYTKNIFVVAKPAVMA
ncbi:GNAT family N-acetyltransferase [Noviherbaspirillum galbum]|uniref:GNAT family N-acetyltransferase n=1 Tax=Noviherbaspirillum galbum TaxID=2709383 RepID=A0A6B3SJ70_9BURK|nr:GNAT family N-acetyltransferase [Noviherbaspirillum galbum]NEX60904.1 GNAT family N-acetyltransferase [Noviherbaspirillum galbum]